MIDHKEKIKRGSPIDWAAYEPQLMRRHNEGWADKKIAEELGLSESAVRSKLYYLKAPHQDVYKPGNGICQACSGEVKGRARWCKTCVPDRKDEIRMKVYGLTKPAWDASALARVESVEGWSDKALSYLKEYALPEQPSIDN